MAKLKKITSDFASLPATAFSPIYSNESRVQGRTVSEDEKEVHPFSGLSFYPAGKRSRHIAGIYSGTLMVAMTGNPIQRFAGDPLMQMLHAAHLQDAAKLAEELDVKARLADIERRAALRSASTVSGPYGDHRLFSDTREDGVSPDEVVAIGSLAAEVQDPNSWTRQEGADIVPQANPAQATNHEGEQ